MDDLARARAVLGVRSGISLAQLKRRYRVLIKQWHPDRFGFDPQGQAEAAVRMREINDAYHKLAQHQVSADAQAAPPTTDRNGRLTPDQIDKAVRALGTDGPLDSLLGLFDLDWNWRAAFQEPINWRRINWRRMSSHIALAFGLLFGTIAERTRVVKDPELTPWVIVVCAVVSWVLLLVLLPKR